MQEAFRRVAEKNPNSPLVSVIKKVDQAQEPERIKARTEKQLTQRKKEFTQLKDEFKQMGNSWLNVIIAKDRHTSPYGYNPIAYTLIKQKREGWLQALTSLKERPLAERIELLEELASGMKLSEDNMTPADDAMYGRKYYDTVLFYKHSYLKIGFTRPSIFFMESFSEMSGYSLEQERKFGEFMREKSGLEGKVDLPQLFPAISRWIDHSSGSHTSGV